MEALIDANIMPILFISDDNDKIDNVIKNLDKVIKNISHIEFITFAYEPINGNLKDLNERIKTISDYLENKYKVKPRIVYGGGVTSKNVKEILQIEELCGIILGTSSTSVSFVKDIIDNM